MEDMEQLFTDMEKFFKKEMPSPFNYPESFKYYIKLYMYFHQDKVYKDR